MNSLKNNVRLMGIVGNDPTIYSFDNNKSMVKISLATIEKFKGPNGNWIKDTQWHTLVLWGKHALFAYDHLHKGLEIAIEGRLKNRRYQDRHGIIRNVTEVVVSKFLSLSKPNNTSEKDQE